MLKRGLFKRPCKCPFWEERQVGTIASCEVAENRGTIEMRGVAGGREAKERRGVDGTFGVAGARRGVGGGLVTRFPLNIHGD